LELLYLPRTVKAEEALELGLATTVVPAADLAAEVGQLAGQLAAGPTVAYGAIRRSVTFSGSHDLEEGTEFEARMMALTGSTEDHRRAVASFMAKEKPTFEGK
jgi:2-(1,2-epoxy-1,2-dihydrophenyl)acetyl-CoA isomerase